MRTVLKTFCQSLGTIIANVVSSKTACEQTLHTLSCFHGQLPTDYYTQGWQVTTIWLGSGNQLFA